MARKAAKEVSGGRALAAAQRSAREIGQRYLGLLEISGEAVLLACDGLVAFANEAACALLGLPQACHLVGRPFLDYIGPESRDKVKEHLAALTVRGQTMAFICIDLLRADGKPFHVELALHACGLDGRAAVQILMRDLTASERMAAEVDHLSQFDSLTGLANRGQFLERLETAVAGAGRSGQRLAVACLGIDNFSAINDAVGQQGGDQVIMQFAERLEQTARIGDTIARVGGDEFGLVLTGLQEDDAAEIAAQRILAALSGAFAVGETKLVTRVSLGIALYPLHAQKRDRLLRKAMLAMKHAEHHGGNQFQLYSAELEILEHDDAQRRILAGLRLQHLTPREREVFDLLVSGKTSKIVARLLGISSRTVEVHRSRVMEKMDAHSVGELVQMTHEVH